MKIGNRVLLGSGVARGGGGGQPGPGPGSLMPWVWINWKSAPGVPKQARGEGGATWVKTGGPGGSGGPKQTGQ